MLKAAILAAMKKQKIIRCIPAENNETPGLHYQPGALLANETMERLIELGKMLRPIYDRLVSEGWTIDAQNEVVISPNGEVYTSERTEKFESQVGQIKEAL